MKQRKSLKVLSLLLAMFCMITSLSTSVSAAATPAPTGEVRGVWISFLEMQTMLTGKTEGEFTKNITTAFDNSKEYGLNTVYVQVRPYSDALYKSSFFPWSHIATGVEGKDPGYDPLAIMVKEAHARGLKIEAWVNPYRVRPADNKKPLSANSPAKKWLDAGDRSVIQSGNLITYNPASTKAQNLIVSGIKEIVQNYAVDGIHIDDYFYPTTGTSFDQTFDLPEYESYKNKGGTLSQASWRRQNVEVLIRKIYTGVKEVNPKVLFGISPASNIDANYSQHYFDVEKVATNEGYCDYLAPQIYFGFNHKTQPYGTTWDRWDQIITNAKVDLYVGIATYKAGKSDGYAGNGKNEWVSNTNRMAEMVSYARGGSNYGGFILYRYDHLFRPESGVKQHIQTERANLKKIL